MKRKATINFFISASVIILFLASGYFGYEFFTIFGITSDSKANFHTEIYALVVGIIYAAYVWKQKREWDSFFFMNTLQLNCCFAAGIIYYAFFSGYPQFNPKIFLHLAGTLTVFILQSVVLYKMSKMPIQKAEIKINSPKTDFKSNTDNADLTDKNG